jgi:hypothetical protein
LPLPARPAASPFSSSTRKAAAGTPTKPALAQGVGCEPSLLKHLDQSQQHTNHRRLIVKTIATALVALSVLAGVVAPASAAGGFSIQQLDQEGRGGHAN